MSAVPWSSKPEIDGLLDTDSFMRYIPTGAVGQKNQLISVLKLKQFIQGSPIVNVSSPADLPTLANGVHTLEFNKNYNFIDPNTFPDPISIPAGWVGKIKQTFLTSEFLNYTGTNPMFSTLNLSGVIDSISDAGSGAITITSTSHGLLDGQYANIHTTSYNQDGLIVSNVTANTFDVQLAFTVDETGNFNTGYGSILLENLSILSVGVTDLMDLTAAPIFGSVLSVSGVSEFGFLKPGIVRDAAAVIIDKSILGFVTDGLTLQDCDTVNISNSNIQSLSAAVTTSRGLILTGAATRVFGTFGCSFTMTAADQRPVRVDSSINAAREILFQNSPDNDIATDYFDTSSGGLDQTNPQVTTINNGLRANSMTISETTTSRILEVDGSGGVAVPIVDVIPVPGDYTADPTIERFSLDTTTGIVTYIGLSPITGFVKFSLSAAQISGAGQTVNITLYINGVPQTKSTITIVTPPVASFVPGIYNGGNFAILPGDTFQLFKDNTTNTINTDISNPILLMNKV